MSNFVFAGRVKVLNDRCFLDGRSKIDSMGGLSMASISNPPVM